MRNILGYSRDRNIVFEGMGFANYVALSAPELCVARISPMNLCHTMQLHVRTVGKRAKSHLICRGTPATGLAGATF